MKPVLHSAALPEVHLIMRYTTLILILALIVGCGSKGPLYLPEEEAAAEQPSASQGANQETVPEPLEEQEDDIEERL